MVGEIVPIRPNIQLPLELEEHHPSENDPEGTHSGNFYKSISTDESIHAFVAMIICVSFLMIIFQLVRWDINPKPVYSPTDYTPGQATTLS